MRGITASSRATGLARSTIGRGLKDLDDPGSVLGKVRRPGSGRPALTSKDTTLLEDLHKLLEVRGPVVPRRPDTRLTNPRLRSGAGGATGPLSR